MVFSFVWLISLSVVISGSVQVVANGSTPPLPVAEWRPIVREHHGCFIQPSVVVGAPDQRAAAAPEPGRDQHLRPGVI